MFFLIDDHGELLGKYDTREEAESDLEMLGQPDDVGIVEMSRPDNQIVQRAILRLLTRIGESFPGGYR